MSKEVYEKSRNLFKVLFTTVFIALFLLVLSAMLTWDYPAIPVSIEYADLDTCSESHQIFLSAMADSFYRSLEKLEDFQDREDAIELVVEKPLNTYELYNSYVDEIVSCFYPALDTEYVKAMIYHESRYESDAYNPKTGVVGLMQINPKWHTQRAMNLGVNDLYDPYGNILVGCDILNELTQQRSFTYAINFFAGGYPYADAYVGCESPYISALNSIIYGFHTGAIYMGGE